MPDTPEASENDSIRAFVCLKLPAEVQEAVGRAVDALRPAEEFVRFVPTSNLHLTLHFFGDVRRADLVPVDTELTALCANAAPLTLNLGALGGFPSLERPRVLWLGLSEGERELTALQAEIADALHGMGFAIDERPFNPHLTIGRVKTSKRGRRKDRKNQRAALEVLQRFEPLALAPFTVDALTLMQSELSPRGARYSVHGSFPFQSATSA